MPSVKGFLPSSNGFRFSNSFASMPLLEIDVGVTKVPIGDASNGLCGGMVYAVRDYHESRSAPPPDTQAPGQNHVLYPFLVDRLFDSFNLPTGPVKYLHLMNPALPDHETWMSRAGFAPRGRAWVMIREEWPKIKADLDQGRLSPLGLVRVKSSNPGDLGKNHQVLAYRYELTGSKLDLYIYDPNYPGNDSACLSLDISQPEHTTSVQCTPSSIGPVYCFFRTEYSFQAPPAAGVHRLKTVPGWFGAEDQGADVALGDINGNGRPDLVVFHIDNPGGENHGYYRVGWNLDTNGNVTGGWSNVKPIPGWFGSENQGGGIAIADISGNGRPDLVVYHTDNPGGENRGYYRIGWNLDANGNVTGGWSDVRPVPGWFGAENQGAGIALYYPPGSPRPNLVVFHLENPAGENYGYYRVGRSLDTFGKVTQGWGPVRPVAGWFGAQNQGAGVAVGNIGGQTTPDLLVFHVDNPGGENHGHYRIVFDIPGY